MNFFGRSFNRTLHTLTCVSVIQLSAGAATIRQDQPDSLYLDLAAQPDFAAVGKFVNSWGYTGNATLIAPNWVLTAAHVLSAASGGTFTLNGNSYESAQMVIHPNWTGNAFNGYDLALVRLNTPVGDVTPAALYTGESEFGQLATYVGYGFTGTGLTGWQTLDNQKRAFQNVIDGDFGNPAVLLGSDLIIPTIPRTMILATPNLCGWKVVWPRATAAGACSSTMAKRRIWPASFRLSRHGMAMPTPTTAMSAALAGFHLLFPGFTASCRNHRPPPCSWRAV